MLCVDSDVRADVFWGAELFTSVFAVFITQIAASAPLGWLMKVHYSLAMLISILPAAV